jgi:DNA-binding MarR family transcriptional regulator
VNTPLDTLPTLGLLSSLGPQRPDELAGHLGATPAELARVLAELNEVEWIRRIAVTDDTREWRIALAPKGLRALATGWAASASSAPASPAAEAA